MPQLAGLIDKASRALREVSIDAAGGLIVSGPDRQISYASAGWAVLAGVMPREENAAMLRRLLACPQADAAVRSRNQQDGDRIFAKCSKRSY